MHVTRFVRIGAAVAVVAGLAACAGTGNMPTTKQGTPSNALALTDSGWLLSFDRAAPQDVVTSVQISGLPAGEKLVGIDVRPVNGWLYALSRTGTLYTVDPATGAATQRAKLMTAPDQQARPFGGLTGTRFTVDFNPVADRLRVISDAGQSLRINVETGGTIVDGSINGGTTTTRITDGAYTNSYAGATATALWVIDGSNATIYLQNPPNNGTLTMPVRLGINANSTQGFDIDAKTGMGYAALAVNGKTGIYRIDPKGTPVASLVSEWRGPAIMDIALR